METHKLKIALAFSHKDKDQAIRLAEWMRELGGCKEYDLVLTHNKLASVDGLIEILRDTFKSVYDNLAFDQEERGWPFSPNNLFRRTAKLMQEGTSPWLWLEPDCACVKEQWIQSLENEYNSCGKPILGMKVEVPGVTTHCTGIAIFPAMLCKYSVQMLLADAIAFDIMGAEEVVDNHCFWSRLICHSWRAPSPNTQQELDALMWPEAVLFHQNKDGQVIKLLRERRQINKEVQVILDQKALNASWKEKALEEVSQVTGLPPESFEINLPEPLPTAHTTPSDEPEVPISSEVPPKPIESPVSQFTKKIVARSKAERDSKRALEKFDTKFEASLKPIKVKRRKKRRMQKASKPVFVNPIEGMK